MYPGHGGQAVVAPKHSFVLRKKDNRVAFQQECILGTAQARLFNKEQRSSLLNRVLHRFYRQNAAEFIRPLHLAIFSCLTNFYAEQAFP